MANSFDDASGHDRKNDGGRRQALVATLFASPFSLAVGAAAGSAGGISAALVASDRATILVGLAIPAVGLLRVLHGLHVHLRPGSAARSGTTEILYEGGAWLFSLLLGLLAFLTLTRTDQASLHLLVACLAIGYAAGVCARNAGRPKVALGQLALAALPISPALALSADPLHWLLAFVNLFFVLGLADITKKTHRIFQSAITGARAREEEYRKAIGHLPVMSWTADRFGESTYQSQRWLEFTGTSEIGSGNTKVGLVHPSDWPELDAAWTRSIKTGCDFKARYRLLHRTGKYRWVLSLGQPERDAGGGIVRWHGACVDVHDEQESEHQEGLVARRA